MKKYLFAGLFACTVATLWGCKEDPAPNPNTFTETAPTYFNLGMKGLSGSDVVGSFGVTDSETSALAGIGQLLSGSVTWLDTKGGKEYKSYVLSTRAKGDKLWVFLKTNKPLTSTQSIMLTWGNVGNLSVTSSTDTLVVQSFTVN